jgi:N-acyl-D-aspartate/D-glutamate deacylase
MHDIVIRGGEVADGTGAEPRRADVAIDGTRVTAVGTVEEKGRREIGATSTRTWTPSCSGIRRRPRRAGTG